MAEFPITMHGMRPMMTAGINGTQVQFMVDSGAFYSTLSPASAAELKLQTRFAPFGFYMQGVGGGRADASIATVKTFTLAGVPLKNVDFLVGGSDMRGGTVGVLGQNVLHIADVEYDLGEGAVRLMKPIDCGQTVLAYWANASTPYSVISIDPGNGLDRHTNGHAYINSVEIRVTFDTGAGSSVLSLRAAARAGIKPDSPGVVPGGMGSGIGKNTFATYIAPFASFKIGDEEIKNTKLRIGDIDLPDADMLLGPDFFLSHRIYVANGQRKLYFTYNCRDADFPRRATVAQTPKVRLCYRPRRGERCRVEGIGPALHPGARLRGRRPAGRGARAIRSVDAVPYGGCPLPYGPHQPMPGPGAEGGRSSRGAQGLHCGPRISAEIESIDRADLRFAGSGPFAYGGIWALDRRLRRISEDQS